MNIRKIEEVVVDDTLKALREFFKLESAGGLTLIAAAILAMIFANTGLAVYYDLILSTNVTVTVGGFGIDKPFLLWINDGLMAVFFMLVGLEIKREVLEGELSSVKQAMLPAIAAVGGIAVPALFYVYINAGDEEALRGWAIPAATDIAFALGILALFGKRVPIALKIFLTAVAVIDDIAAVAIIALFYTANLSVGSLFIAGLCVLALVVLNMKKSARTSAYVFIGIIMWLAVLKSGVHATLAGVVLGLLIPHNTKTQHGKCMLKSLEHDLHPWVAFMVLPIFAFANAGIHLEGMSIDDVMAPIPLGIAAGLFLGKPIGIFGISFIAIMIGIAKLPDGVTWKQFLAVCWLCGVGFTMSLFIGGLAFEVSDREIQSRVGIIVGSLLSGIFAAALLAMSLPKKREVTKASKQSA